jgi:hypothetical protein
MSAFCCAGGCVGDVASTALSVRRPPVLRSRWRSSTCKTRTWVIYGFLNTCSLGCQSITTCPLSFITDNMAISI